MFLRRRSQSEDDNPPSPVVALESGGGSNPGSASTPQSAEQGNLQASPSVPSPFLAAPGGHIRPQSPATRGDLTSFLHKFYIFLYLKSSFVRPKSLSHKSKVFLILLYFFLLTSDTAGSSGAGSSGGLRFHPPLTPPSNPHTPASPHPGGGMVR